MPNSKIVKTTAAPGTTRKKRACVHALIYNDIVAHFGVDKTGAGAEALSGPGAPRNAPTAAQLGSIIAAGLTFSGLSLPGNARPQNVQCGQMSGEVWVAMNVAPIVASSTAGLSTLRHGVEVSHK